MPDLTLSSTADTLAIVGGAPLSTFAVSSTPAIFTIVPVQPERWIGGDTDVAGAGAGMSLSLSLVLG